jgi:hypothetical protein
VTCGGLLVDHHSAHWILDHAGLLAIVVAAGARDGVCTIIRVGAEP